MSNYKLLNEKLDLLENKVKAFESKQVGTLYHVCTLEAYLKYILPKDQLQASGMYHNWVYGSNDYVSFTRNKGYVLDTIDENIVLIQLVVDGDKLSEHYKIGPYNDFAFGKSGMKMYDDPTRREAEETVRGPIVNISKYIKEVRFDIAASHNLTEEQDLVLLKRKKKLLSNIVYYKFLGNKSANLGIPSGASLQEALDTIDDWYINESKQELLFSYSLPKIKKAIAAGADVNRKHDADGYPLVYYSEDDESIPIIKTLLKAGANPNVTLNDDTPIICYTIDNWCDEITKLLIKSGADVNAADSDGMTALMHAADNANDNIVEILIKSGADPNAADNMNYTPLMYASAAGDQDTIKWLLDAGVNINAENSKGETALSVAKSKQVKSLLKKAGAV